MDKPKVTVVENVPQSAISEKKATLKEDKATLKEQKVESIVKDGPFRKYLSSKIYHLCHVGQLNSMDYLIFCSFVVGFFYYMMNGIAIHLDDKEKRFLEIAQLAYERKFYLASEPSLGIQIMSKLVPILDIKNLKFFMLSCSSLTLGVLYLLIRRNNVVMPIALMMTVVLSKIPEFQEQSIKIGVNPLFYLSFLCVMFCWRSYRISDLPALPWLILVGIMLGVNMTIRKLGFVTWVWIIFCSLLDTWHTLDDISVAMFTIIKKVLYKFSFIVVLPLRLFVLFNELQINSMDADTAKFSCYMTIPFQHWLRGNSVNATEAHEVFYGDTVKIRHVGSLAGYVVSHNLTYADDDTLVTMSFEENSNLTHWILEPKNLVDFGEPVYNFDEVKFRHKITGQLLRASEAGPPVSEQEYDRSVLCTGDSKFRGSADEEWTLEVNGKYKDELNFNITEDTFQLFNRGRGCKLLGHDTRVNWGKNLPLQQELICLDKPNEKLVNFQMELVESTEAMDVVNVTAPNKYYLIWEWLRDQFKYDYYILNFDADSSLQPYNMMEDVEMWPISIHYAHDKVSNMLWISCDIAVILMTIYIFKQILGCNPWGSGENEQTMTTLHVRLLRDTGVEYLLGWFMHWYIFTYSPKRDALKIVEFVPSLIIGVLIWSQLYNSLYHWNKGTIILLPVILLILQYVN